MCVWGGGVCQVVFWPSTCLLKDRALAIHAWKAARTPLPVSLFLMPPTPSEPQSALPAPTGSIVPNTCKPPSCPRPQVTLSGWAQMLFTWPQSCESFVAKSGLFSSLPNPLPYFGGLSFTAACQSSGSWEGNEAEELRRRAPHCEGNVDSQPMHFNAGKLPAKPEGCAWAPGSPAFCSSTGLELMPSFPPGLGSCRNLSTTTGCPPANRRATVPLLTFHKHLLTE